MKKIISLIVVIFLFYSCSFYKSQENKEVILGEKTVAPNESSISASGVIEEITKVDIEKECKKIINGEKSDYLGDNKLIEEYQVYILENNAVKYLDFSNLKKGNCSYFSSEEDGEKLCQMIQKGNMSDLSKYIKEGSYDFILMKSFSSGENYCNLLSDSMEQKECDMYVSNYSNLFKLDINKAFTESVIVRQKIINDFGKDKYLEMLNNEFLEKCYLLEIKDLKK